MDCTLIEGELIPFHFNTLGEAPRAELETHLMACPRCLQAYLELKRAVEQGGTPLERPSPMLKARLRGEVAAEFVRPRRPLFWGAVAATLVVATLLGLWAHRAPSAPPPAPPITGPVDTARPAAAPIRFL